MNQSKIGMNKQQINMKVSWEKVIGWENWRVSSIINAIIDLLVTSEKR